MDLLRPLAARLHGRGHVRQGRAQTGRPRGRRAFPPDRDLDLRPGRMAFRPHLRAPLLRLRSGCSGLPPEGVAGEAPLRRPSVAVGSPAGPGAAGHRHRGDHGVRAPRPRHPGRRPELLGRDRGCGACRPGRQHRGSRGRHPAVHQRHHGPAQGVRDTALRLRLADPLRRPRPRAAGRRSPVHHQRSGLGLRALHDGAGTHGKGHTPAQLLRPLRSGGLARGDDRRVGHVHHRRSHRVPQPGRRGRAPGRAVES